ncbi:MAG: hypothetical protein AAGJ81_01180 [Verrucomicrobiota bacterium]
MERHLSGKMLKAKKDRFRTWILFRYCRWSMRKKFFSVRLYVDRAAFQEAQTFPLILYGNHCYWWDGLMETLIFDQLMLDYYIMMEEKNLRQFPFFQKTGVFGVDLESREGRSQALLYAARLLRSDSLRRTLVMYPHGKLVEDFDEWPEFHAGLEGLLRLNEQAKARPMAKKIHAGRYPLPEAVLRIGSPTESNGLEEGLRETYGELMDDIRDSRTEDRLWLIPPPRKWRGNTD